MCAAVAIVRGAGAAVMAVWPAEAVLPTGLVAEAAGLLTPDAAGYAATTSPGADCPPSRIAASRGVGVDAAASAGAYACWCGATDVSWEAMGFAAVSLLTGTTPATAATTPTAIATVNVVERLTLLVPNDIEEIPL
jgi:hypothetical protein